jgi:eukaryotic-like serine/threonine-protein kinase
MDGNQNQGWWLISSGIMTREALSPVFNNFVSKSKGQDLCGYLLAQNIITAAQAFDIRDKASKGPPSNNSGTIQSHGPPSSQPSSKPPQASKPDSKNLNPKTPDSSQKNTSSPPPFINIAAKTQMLQTNMKPSTAPKLQSPVIKVGGQIGPYQLIKELGRGGMGVVFQAKHAKLPRPVALKIINASYQENKVALERFEIEARAMNRLRHPNIVEVYDIVTSADHAYMTMSLITGGSLADLLNKAPNRLLDLRQSITYCASLAHALHHAHSHSIIHRDLKPGNILLTEDNQPLITDFGLAKALDSKNTGLSVTGQFVGTLAYMPPEQANGEHQLIDPRSDIYSLGATLFEMLSGQAPFEADNQIELLRKVLFTTAPAIRQINPNIPKEIETIVARCLAKDQRHRYSSAENVAKDCERWLEGHPIHANPFQFREKYQIWRGQNPALAKVIPITAALLITLCASFITWSWRLSYESKVKSAQKDARLARAHADQLTQSEEIAKKALKTANFARHQANENYKKAKKAKNEALKAKNDALIAGEKLQEALLKTETAQNQAERTITKGFLEKSKTEFANKRWSQAAVMASESLARINLVKKLDPALKSLQSKADQLLGLTKFRSGWLWRSPAALRLTSLAIAVSEKKGILAAIEERTILLWDLHTGRQIGRLDGHTETVQCLDFSKDGAYLASGDASGECRLWRTDIQRIHKIYPIHNDSIMAVAFHPKKAILATASLDRSVRFQEFKKNRELRPLRGLGAKVSCLAYSPNGERFAVGLTDKSIRLFKSATFNETKRLYGHSNYISALAFSHDGRLLATASADRSIKLWNVDQGKEQMQFSGFKGRIFQVAFSADDSMLAVASTNQGIRLFSLHDKSKKKDAQAALTCYSLCFFKDAKKQVKLAGSFSDRTLKIMTLADLKVTHAVSGHAGPVNAVAPHPNNKEVISISDDGSARFWHIKRGSQVRIHKHGRQRLSALAISPDQQLLAISSTTGTIQILDPLSLKIKATIAPKIDQVDPKTKVVKKINTGVRALCFSPDNKALAVAATNKQIYFLNPKNGAEIKKINPGAACHHLCFSSDGLTLLLSLSNKSAILWDLDENKLARRFTGHSGAVRQALFKPRSDDQIIATASLDNTIRLWDRYNGRQILKLTGHASDVFAIDFTKDGRFLASASDDGTIRLWDLQSGQQKRILTGSQGPVTALAFTNDDRALISATANRTVRLWAVNHGLEQSRAKTSKKIQRVIRCPSQSGPSYCGQINSREWISSKDPLFKNHSSFVSKNPFTAFTACENQGQLVFLLGQATGLIEVRTTTSEKTLRVLKGHSKPIDVLNVSHNGEKLLSGSRDLTMRLWDIASGRESQVFKKHKSVITALAHNNNNNRQAASGTANGLVRLFATSSGKLQKLLEAHRRRIHKLLFTTLQQRNLLLSCSDDKTIVLWDAQTGAFIRRFQGHLSAVTDLALSNNPRYFASCSKDQSIRIWDIETAEEVWRYEGHQAKVSSVLFIHDKAGGQLLSASDDSSLRLWDLALPKQSQASPQFLKLHFQSLAGLRIKGFRTLSDNNTHLFPMKKN